MSDPSGEKSSKRQRLESQDEEQQQHEHHASESTGYHRVGSPSQRPPSPIVQRSPETKTTREPSPKPSDYLKGPSDFPRSKSPVLNLPSSDPEPSQETSTPVSEPRFIPSDSYQCPEEHFEFEYHEEVDETLLAQLMSEGPRPLYSGSDLTLHESMVSVLTFVQEFSLSGQCTHALLKLINLHLPHGNIFKKTLHLFKDYFSNLREDVVYDYYCSKCLKSCEGKKCVECDGKAPLCYLITMPIIPQLKKMFKRKDFVNKLIDGNQRCDPKNLSDVFDGKVYKAHGKMLGVPNVSLMWYTDGAAYGTSSIWPVMLTIDELPYSERFKKENIIIPSVWCGPVKPHGNLLFSKTQPELLKLKDGVDIEINGVGVKLVKCVTMDGTGDGPARCLMLNMTAQNGECSCPKCYQPGEPREGHFGVRVFPYRPNEMELRDDKTFTEDGDIALVLKHSNAYRGVKGPTILSKISRFPVQGTGMDVMHLVYGGVCKTLTKMYVDDSFSKVPFHLSQAHQDLIDDRLLQIKVPACLTRVTRPTQDMANWKTSLWKSWFLYLSVPVLKGVISDFRLRHYGSLVAAIQYLNSECVTQEHLQKADQLLIKFVSYFEDMYGRAYMTLSIHLLLHLCSLVMELGPLWVTSCFPLESLNGVLINLVHGTRFIEKQIASSINMCLEQSNLISNMKVSEAKSFCQEMVKTFKGGKKAAIGKCWVIGDLKDQPIPAHLMKASQVLGWDQSKNIVVCHSIRLNKVLYVATSHPRNIARDSSCASYKDGDELKVGVLNTFVKCLCQCVPSACNCKLFAAIQIVKEVGNFQTLVDSISVPNIHEYETTAEYIFVDVNNLYDVCVKVKFENKLYIAKRCNRLEVE